MRVFSRANGLLTFKSHASCNSGSQILTIGTFADARQMTLSMPSTKRVSMSKQKEEGQVRTYVCLEPQPRCAWTRALLGVWLHKHQLQEKISACPGSVGESPKQEDAPSESFELSRLPDEPKTLTLISLPGHSPFKMSSNF